MKSLKYSHNFSGNFCPTPGTSYWINLDYKQEILFVWNITTDPCLATAQMTLLSSIKMACYPENSFWARLIQKTSSFIGNLVSSCVRRISPSLEEIQVTIQHEQKPLEVQRYGKRREDSYFVVFLSIKDQKKVKLDVGKGTAGDGSIFMIHNGSILVSVVKEWQNGKRHTHFKFEASRLDANKKLAEFRYESSDQAGEFIVARAVEVEPGFG